MHGTAHARPALTAVGGDAPYTWKLASGSSPLPKGRRPNEATGTVTCTPKGHGIYPSTVQVADTRTETEPPVQHTATHTFSITVA